MQKRWILFTGLCLAAGMLVGACGKSSDDETAPHNTSILTVCYKDDSIPDSGEIYLVTNGVYEMILPDGFYPENVDISSDGTMIAYSKGKDALAEIYVMDLSNRQETRITTNAFQDYNPNLSPDKREVVYWSSRIGSTQLYISNTDGTGERNIINDPNVYTFDPEWSHDGTLIAFNYDTTQTGCKAVIYAGILNSSHTGFDALFPVSDTGGAYVEVDPAWSSEDSRIAFSTYEGPGCWHTEGLQSQNLAQWKLKTVTVDKPGRRGYDLQTVWQSSGTHVNWLPIWAENDAGLLVIHSIVDDSPDRPFGTTSHLALYDIKHALETAVPGSEGCYWCDYLRQ